jgi:hypothetical protein
MKARGLTPLKLSRKGVENNNKRLCEKQKNSRK